MKEATIVSSRESTKETQLCRMLHNEFQGVSLPLSLAIKIYETYVWVYHLSSSVSSATINVNSGLENQASR